jgi:hypothetical protein
MYNTQDNTVRVFGIVHKQIGKSLHGREAEVARQQLKSPMPQKRPPRHPRRGLRHGDREAIRECRASSAFSDVVDGFVDVAERSG